MEVFVITTLREVSWDSKRLRQGESLEACFFEWVVTNDFIELAIAIVSTVKGLKWD
jgi:hypothetical protein